MEPIIREVRAEDLETVTAVEAACFPPAEAAERASLAQRIQTFPESFLVAEVDGTIVGFINGCVTNEQTISDRMFEEAGLHNSSGCYQSVFGLDVMPAYRHRGLAGDLMKALIARARTQNRSGMILTCKDTLIGFYESFGYVNKGVSASTHGGAIWYDMMMEF